ncbi:hypothetical protein C0995_016660, partial [Termitomyces sp. Mi166
ASTPSNPLKIMSKPAPSTLSNIVKPKSIVNNPPPLENIQNPDKIDEETVENLPKPPQHALDITKTQDSPSTNAPHLHMR